jgi:YegS/Rv2252/BmrU family lipid kinase
MQNTDTHIDQPVQSNEPHVDDGGAKPEALYKRVVVIVNPAAGQDKPILGTLNKAFREASIDWDMQLTKEAGDAYRLARDAAAAGVDAVAVYGGDGTVMEVANGLIGTGVPMAIFPGGTANVMSVELGIPSDLAEATALVAGSASAVRTVDLGRVGDRYFLLRVGIGFEADMMNAADHDTKERMGRFAYVLSALQALQQRTIARYTLDLDGERVEVDGLTCMIANSGNMGLPGVQMAQDIDVSDGLLDVLVVNDAAVGTLLSVAASAIGVSDPLQRWKAKRVTVTTDPPQAIICDGEPLESGTVTAEVVPAALKVIVPATAPAAEPVESANTGATTNGLTPSAQAT